MDLEKMAIERLRTASEMSEIWHKSPLIVTISGGKDSAVLLHLAKASGIKFEASHNHTTADAPETVYHVRKVFSDLEEQGIKCNVNMPTYKGSRVSMWTLIPQKLMPPTRLVRYCCDVLKEQGDPGRMISTGVRWAESNSRKENRAVYEKISKRKENRILLSDNDDKRMLFENCSLKANRVANPIIDWTDKDIWDYIATEKIEVNPLYAEGFARVGCVGCPMASKKGRELEFLRWPKYRDAYIKAFERMIEARILKGKVDGNWRIGTTGKDVFNWWMEYDIIPGQIDFEDYLK